MKSKLVIAAIVFQLVALLWMASSRELIIQTGHQVKLQTAPIDPRDLFRGDFVRLNFEMNQLPVSFLAAHLQGKDLKKGVKLYALLDKDQHGYIQVTGLTDQVPESDKLFIGARLARKHSKRSGKQTPLKLKYGIEQYFVEQGKGLALEKKRGTRTGLQVPMIMQIALSDSGTAVLKSHDWGRVGMQLTVQRQVNRNRGEETQQITSGSFKLMLKNVSKKSIDLPFKPGNCSFRLVSTLTSPLQLSHKPHGCSDLIPDTKTLKPDETRFFEFDFNQPQWHVMIDGKATSIGTLKWQQRFRLVYDEIDPRAITGTALKSRAFHGRGRID